MEGHVRFHVHLGARYHQDVWILKIGNHLAGMKLRWVSARALADNRYWTKSGRGSYSTSTKYQQAARNRGFLLESAAFYRQTLANDNRYRFQSFSIECSAVTGLIVITSPHSESRGGSVPWRVHRLKLIAPPEGDRHKGRRTTGRPRAARSFHTNITS